MAAMCGVVGSLIHCTSILEVNESSRSGSNDTFKVLHVGGFVVLTSVC